MNQDAWAMTLGTKLFAWEQIGDALSVHGGGRGGTLKCGQVPWNCAEVPFTIKPLTHVPENWLGNRDPE